MIKPKNPYPDPSHIGDGYDVGYAAGLRDGEARLARALRRAAIGAALVMGYENTPALPLAWIKDWLTARQKSRRKKKNPLEKLYKTKKFKVEWEKSK